MIDLLNDWLTEWLNDWILLRLLFLMSCVIVTWKVHKWHYCFLFLSLYMRIPLAKISSSLSKVTYQERPMEDTSLVIWGNQKAQQTPHYLLSDVKWSTHINTLWKLDCHNRQSWTSNIMATITCMQWALTIFF